MTTNVSIRPERTADWPDIDAVHRDAFGADHGIPDLVHDLREQEGPFESISLVAQSDVILGHVMLSHAWLDSPTRLIDVLVLSPLGVRPEAQRSGIGSALIEHALKAAEAAGAPLLFLEGNHRYYGPRGFEKAGDLGFRRPSVRIPEPAFQVARLSSYTSDMTGTFVYRDAHWRHGVGLYRSPKSD